MGRQQLNAANTQTESSSNATDVLDYWRVPLLMAENNEDYDRTKVWQKQNVALHTSRMCVCVECVWFLLAHVIAGRCIIDTGYSLS